MPTPNSFDDEWFAARTKVDPETGCFVWQLGTAKGGYGKTSRCRRSVMAHRMAWELRKGQIPSGMILCHRCDNPPCCNVDHLFLGTHKQNSSDMVAKGRQAKGEKINRAKLTAKQVAEIRSARGTHREIAACFGVTMSAIKHIRAGRIWKHTL